MRWFFRSAAALAVLAGIFLARQPLLGTWYADLGAVSMARVDLLAFPSDEWARGENAPRYTPAQALFLRALHYQPDNVTANYRLGLVDMLRRDYSAAVPRLEAALAADPGHRGVQKALGFSYVWIGAFEKATPLLRHIPEARDELEAYADWWRIQGRTDLAARAEEMRRMIAGGGS